MLRNQPMGTEDALRAWRRLLMGLHKMWALMVRWHQLDYVRKEFMHRSPALMGYVQAMQAAGTSSSSTSSMASGTSQRTTTARYPTAIPDCPHPAAATRRTGNAHGRFMECAECGLVKKALEKDYEIPLSGARVPVFARLHGYRTAPGGKIHKFKLLPREEAYYGSLDACYSHSSLRALAASTIEEVTQRKKPQAKAKAQAQRPSDGGCRGGLVDDGTLKPLSSGIQRRLKHNARRALALSRVSRGAVQTHLSSASWPRRTFRYDILEVFGGTSMVSLRAGRNWGLRVLQPIDIRYGVDLRRRQCRRWLLKMLGVWNPRLVLVEYPCTPWSILQRNVNYRDRPEELRARQEADRPFLKLCRDIFESQVKRGAHAICENPAAADSHREPEIMSLREAHFETTSCLCQFGMTGKQGLPMLKRVRFIATHEIFVQHLDRQCDYTHQHELVEGRNTSTSAAYPAGLADAICKALIEVKELEDYGQKHDWDPYTPRKAHYVDIIREEDQWLPILELAKEQLARKVQPSVFVDPHTELYRKVQELVPWQIANIQVSHLPKAKRVRPGLERCHRASILQLNDDHLVIETEYLPEAQAPRERFVTPVRYAIFVLGYAPGDPQDPSPAAAQPIQPYMEEQPHEVVSDPYAEALQQEGLVRQDFAGECWFVGPPLTAQQKKLAPSLVRMHRNLGHPRQPDFTRALAQQDRLDPEVLALSRRLRCATCERTRRPLPPRPTSLRSTPAFNTKLALDLVYLHDSEGGKFQYLHIVDPAGGFNVFTLLRTREPLEALEKFTDCWASWAGYPQAMRLDRDGAFGAEFWDKLTNAGVELEYIPAEAHWQAGDVEAYNRAFQTVGSKLIDEHSLVGELDMKMLGALVGSALNSKVRMSGASPNQWVCGKDPAVPGDLLNMDGNLENLQGMSQDAELRRRAQVRAKADAYLSEYRVDEALRRAVSRQGRPPRQRYEPGELVAFWRNVKRRKGKLVQPGWFRGTVIGPHKGSEEGQQSNYWISSNGRCVLVSLEQLRPALGTELWPIQELDLQYIEDNMLEEYHDERGDAPLPTDYADEPLESIVVPVYDPGAVDLPPAHGAATSSAPTDVTQLSPTATRAPGTPVAGLFPLAGDRRSADGDQNLPDAKRARLDTEGSATSDVELAQEEEQVVSYERPPHESVSAPTEQISTVLEAALHSDKWRLTDDLNWLVRQHRKPRRSLFSPHEVSSAPVATGHIGTERQTVVYYTQSYEADNSNGTDVDKHYVKDTWDSDVISRDLRHEWVGETWFRLSHATRKEAKALEKEIPFHLIPEEEREAYAAALSKEWGTWMKYGAVKVLSTEASRAVEERVDRRRILDTRVCYRNKNAAYPWMPPKHKARIVCRGDRDPDLTTLRRDAPTMSRTGLMMILCIAGCMPDWFLFNADITGAFLQGDQSMASRKEALYVRPPREGLPGLQRGQLLLVVRGIFGLANSPRLFWRHLRDALIKLGFRQSTLDRAVFSFYRDQKLILVLGCHVDDLIGTGVPGLADDVLKQLKETFDFGAWADSREEEVLEYGGKQVRKLPDGTVTLTQEKFIRATEASSIPRWRSATPNAALLPSELTELRSVGGCLHLWSVRLDRTWQQALLCTCRESER